VVAPPAEATAAAEAEAITAQKEEGKCFWRLLPRRVLLFILIDDDDDNNNNNNNEWVAVVVFPIADGPCE